MKLRRAALPRDILHVEFVEAAATVMLEGESWGHLVYHEPRNVGKLLPNNVEDKPAEMAPETLSAD
jgi:hypothetical protein